MMVDGHYVNLGPGMASNRRDQNGLASCHPIFAVSTPQIQAGQFARAVT